MSFLTMLIDALGSMDVDAITVHEERCISVRNRNAHCLRCVEACAGGVLSFDGARLQVEPGKCIGCGTCATACPTCALEVTQPSDGQLTKQLKASMRATNGHPVLACQRAIDLQVAADPDLQASGPFARKALAGKRALDQGALVAVPCLGRVDESLLVGAAAYGAHGVTLACGCCEACAHAAGGAMVRTVIESAGNLLRAFGSTMPVTLQQGLPDQVFGDALQLAETQRGRAVDGSSRRDFLAGAKDAAADAAVLAAKDKLGQAAPDAQGSQQSAPAAFRKVGRDDTLGHFTPSRRTRVYNYLAHLGQPQAKSVDTRIVGAVSINAETCSACRMCAVFCPTGALAKVDEDGFFGLAHRPSLCMQCTACQQVCPGGAITVSPTVPLDQFMGRKAVCFAMEKPSWTPNKPDSMYSKIHAVLGPDMEMCMF